MAHQIKSPLPLQARSTQPDPGVSFGFGDKIHDLSNLLAYHPASIVDDRPALGCASGDGDDANVGRDVSTDRIAVGSDSNAGKAETSTDSHSDIRDSGVPQEAVADVSDADGAEIPIDGDSSADSADDASGYEPDVTTIDVSARGPGYE